jgi:hypothetical protein
MPALPGKRTDNLESHLGIEKRSEFSVKYGIMEAFRMHNLMLETPSRSESAAAVIEDLGILRGYSSGRRKA